jgi:hypothetical protein
MKDGKDKIGQDVGAECIKNKVAPPFGKCSWKFYFDPTRGLDVIESLVEHMLEEGYLPKNASGRVEIGDKKYTKSQIVDMYRDKPLPEIIAALQAIDERRTKDLLQPKQKKRNHRASIGRLFSITIKKIIFNSLQLIIISALASCRFVDRCRLHGQFRRG